jgi:atypical dual specificity phosphatase
MTPSRILPQLFVGPCPADARDVECLKRDYAVTAILSLQPDDDCGASEKDRIEDRCRELGITSRRIPVEAFDGDDGLETLCRCVASLDELLRGGHTVYIHCNRGMVRSPSAVLAYLVWRQGWSLTDALDHLQRCHPSSPDIAAVLLASDRGRGAAA